MAHYSYLKWVGGKAQLAIRLLDQFPKDINQYIEPFFGSGSMGFAYMQSAAPRFDDCFDDPAKVKVLANDSNKILMNCHRIVADKPDKLFARLKEMSEEFRASKDSLEFYKEKRKEINDISGKTPLEVAALFVFINKTCFNGLWRVNSKGGFNVPWGQRDPEQVKFSEDRIKQCSSFLSKYVTVYSQDFESFVKESVGEGDFVFLDPPYVPLSATSSFTSYNSDGWTAVDDERLASTLLHIDSVGAKFMMTNSAAGKVFELFGRWQISTVDAHRFIKAVTSDNETREKVKETVITNYSV